MSAYVYQPVERLPDFDVAVAELKRSGREVVVGGIDNTSAGSVLKIVKAAQDEGVPFYEFVIDPLRFQDYVTRADYGGRHRSYCDNYPGILPEKLAEHFVTLNLLGVNKYDVFVDLANEQSPVPDIYAALTGCKAWRQDIMFEPGIHGDRIGGDAAALSVSDGFFTKAALTCSLEHFEEDADTRLFRELARVLRPGGKVVIAPYYVYSEAAVQTDPLLSVPAKVPFDPGVPVFCAKGWGNRHGRFYSPASFRSRIMAAVGDKFDFAFHHFVNAHEVDAMVYLRFAAVATRR